MNDKGEHESIDYKGIGISGMKTYIVSMLILPISFFIRILFARTLSIEDYGNFYSIIAFLSLLDVVRFFGVNFQTCSFFINKYKMEKRADKMKGFFNFSFVLVSITTIIIASILFIFSDGIGKFVFDNAGHIQAMLPWMIGFWIFSGMLQFLGFFLISYLKQTKYQLIMLIMHGSYLIMFILLSLALEPYLAAVQAYFVGALIGAIIAIFPFVKESRFFLKTKAFFSSRMGKEILGFSMNLILLAFIGTMLAQTDTFLIQLIKGSEDAAYYNVAFPTANLILILISPLAIIIAPLFSKLWHEKNRKALNRIESFLINNFLVAILPVVVFLVMFSKTIIYYIFGAGYVEAHLSLELFSFFFIFKGINTIIIPMIVSMGRPQKASRIMLIGLIINIALDLILVPSLSYLGATISTGIAQIMMSIFFIKELKRIEPFRFSWWQNIKVIIAAALFIAVVFGLKSIIPLASIGSDLLTIIAGGGIFLVGLCAYILFLVLVRVITKEKVMILKNIFFWRG